MHNYVVSDIHGNGERLGALINVLNKKHPEKNYMLHIMGDLFDRGDSSAQVFELIEENKNINLLLGNHEMIFMQFMENPQVRYMDWNFNGGDRTIRSFADEILALLLDGRVANNENKLKEVYNAVLQNAKSRKNEKLDKNFSKYVQILQENILGREDITTQEYIEAKIDRTYPQLNKSVKQKIRNITYHLLIDKFYDMYEMFEQAKSYQIVDNKYLLVHSGNVAPNQNPELKESGSPYINFKNCKTRADLKNQDVYSMVWSRRKNESGLAVAPNERFDNLIIVYGHTTVDRFRQGENSLDPHITYDKKGRVASIGIDGKNFDKSSGQLNCLNLDKLSLMAIKGSNEANKRNRNASPLTMTETPIKTHEKQNFLMQLFGK